jgi:hypothetical protein
MSWKNNRPQSAWREFNFVYHQLQRAIEPRLALEDMITDWGDISKMLSECPRKRKTQISKHYLF